MENKNNNKGVIVLLIIIIIILAVLCVLFATGTISLSTSTTKNSEQTSENNNVVDNKSDINESSNDSVSAVVGYYRTGYEVAQNQFEIIEYELRSDKTVNYVIGYSSNTENTDAKAAMSYSGTYTENEKDVIISIESTDKNCEDGKYTCKDSITLWKSDQSNGSLIEYREDAPEYFKVGKDKLVLIK